MKKGLVIVLSALVLASCGRPQRTVSPKSSDTKQTSTSEKKQSGMDLKAIKAKDYSSIKGTWIDGRGNELVFDDKGLVSEDVELDASSFKQKDQIAEMTVSAKSGVGGYGLLLLPKGQKAGKDDASDKSKDRIWAGQSPAYGDDDNFYLIDQHAAHERVNYEKFINAYFSSEKNSQILLLPFTFDAPNILTTDDEEWLSALSAMGYLIESFGENTYIVKEIPEFVTISEAESFVNDFIDSFAEGVKLNNTIVIDKLITKSCKSAIKAHDMISKEEAEELLRSLKQCRNPFSCPHGRPTFVRFSIREIERMFKRIV